MSQEPRNRPNVTAATKLSCLEKLHLFAHCSTALFGPFEVVCQFYDSWF